MKKSLFKKVLGLTVVLAMLLQSLGGIVFADTTLTGDGSAENPYQIGTYQELEYFRDLVNDGEVGIHAILTADIAISDGAEWYPLGNATYPYSGIFDGAGYKISNLALNSTGWHAGFFGGTNGATIKNLTVEGNVTSTAAYAGGLIGQANNTTIEYCTFMGNVTGVGGAIAGFIGRTDNAAFTTINNTIKNSAFIGNVTNSASGSASGFAYSKTDVTNSYIVGDVTGHTEVTGVGWQSTATNCFAYGTLTANTTNGYVCRIAGTATNCYYLNHVTKSLAGQGTQKTVTDFKNGSIAYALGDAFGQTIGTDDYPVFRTETNKVILNENGDYINEGGAAIEKEPIEIGSYNDLVTFRNMVNAGETDADAILTADIDLSVESSWTPIGVYAAGTDDATDVDIKYTGTFDGNGHKLTNFIIAGNYRGLFAYTDGATIKNLTIEGGTRADGKGSSHGLNNGAFAATAVGTTIENCKFIGNVTGYSTIAGFLGYTDLASSSMNTITNSAFIGNLTSESNAASGFARMYTLVKNSYLIGDVTGKSEVSAFGLRATVENCFTYGTITATGTGTWDKAYPICAPDATNFGNSATNAYYFNAVASSGVAGGGTKATDYEFKSGKIAHLLGDAFGQTIGTDNHPVFRTETNAVITNANGNYINEGGEPLVYVWEISTYDQLVEFRNAVNAKNGVAMAGKVELLADITIPDGVNWTPIGTWTWAASPFDSSKDAIFTGTFNGNGHKITNVVVDGLDPAWHSGFFRQTNGATIKNLTIEGNIGTYDGTNYSIDAYAGGLIGAANGTTIENCTFRGNVYAKNMAAGYIVRTDTATVDNNIINCVFDGTVQSELGWASGFAYKNTNIENSYSLGTVTGKTEVSAFGLWTGVKNSFSYGSVIATNGSVYPISAGKLGRDGVNDQSAVSNCYYSNLVAGGLGTQAQMMEFINGKVCYLLNQGAGEIIYGQTIGTELYPGFYNNNMVYISGDTYVNGTGAFAGVNAEKASVIASEDTFVMVAQYAKDGDVETLLAVTPVNVTANQLYTQNITQMEGADVYKVFVWNSMTGMIPVCNNAEYVIEQ
ncbi:MAG: hypothetical protein E7415_05340 [Ruminococcaceae bacterium]|nr:hypothetical protein [Oscillospiraceae bacterium]